MFNFNRKEKGQGLVEYALILVLIAIVVIVAMRALGTTVNGTFTSVNAALEREESASSSGCDSYWAAEDAASDVYFACLDAASGSCDSESDAHDAAVDATNACLGGG